LFFVLTAQVEKCQFNMAQFNTEQFNTEQFNTEQYNPLSHIHPLYGTHPHPAMRPGKDLKLTRIKRYFDTSQINSHDSSGSTRCSNYIMAEICGHLECIVHLDKSNSRNYHTTRCAALSGSLATVIYLACGDVDFVRTEHDIHLNLVANPAHEINFAWAAFYGYFNILRWYEERFPIGIEIIKYMGMGGYTDCIQWLYESRRVKYYKSIAPRYYRMLYKAKHCRVLPPLTRNAVLAIAKFGQVDSLRYLLNLGCRHSEPWSGWVRRSEIVDTVTRRFMYAADMSTASWPHSQRYLVYDFNESENTLKQLMVKEFQQNLLVHECLLSDKFDIYGGAMREISSKIL
jgi:hypothetical protein